MSPAVTFDVANEANSVTLSNIIYEVHRKLGNLPRKTSCTLVTDGAKTVYSLRDSPVYTDYVDNSSRVYVVDSETGVVTYTTPPAAGTVVATYSAMYWSETQIIDAINEALASLWPRLYAYGTETIATTGSSVYNCSSSVGLSDELFSVEYEFATGLWLELPKWRSVIEAATPRKVLVLEQPPPTGKFLRLLYAMHPTPFPGLSTSTEYLEQTGLPRFARTPIVLSACALLVDNRIVRRTREDRGHDSQNEATVAVEDLVNLAREFRAEAERVTAELQMPAPPAYRQAQTEKTSEEVKSS